MRSELAVKEIGIAAEQYVMSQLNNVGIPHEYQDDYFDILIAKKIKLEVKSTMFVVHNGKNSCKYGRFDFTDEDNRNQLVKDNAWICLVIHHMGQHIFYGFLNAFDLKGKRYLSLTEVRTMRVLSFDEFVSMVRTRLARGAGI